MNSRPSILSLMALVALLVACEGPQPGAATYCRFVPERSDDFAWENDKIAFRAYGPALRDGTENGGVDCWLKRVDYPVIDKWYKKHVEGGTYHEDDGEGYDPYHVGASLGCGGIGLWLDDRLVASETFVGWRVIQCGPVESVFELDYAWEYEGHAYAETRRCTIRPGDRLFHTTATFWKDGALATNLPVAIGITTHDGKAKAVGDAAQGWMACWEGIDGFGLGTGVAMDPDAIGEYKLLDSATPDVGHALFISSTDAQGRVSWWAGYGWERAGEIKTLDEWRSHLIDFAKRH